MLSEPRYPVWLRRVAGPEKSLAEAGRKGSRPLFYFDNAFKVAMRHSETSSCD